jgi:hypothetical protein
MADSYDFWRRALNGEPIGSPDLQVHPDRPQCGFYRMKGPGPVWYPVAIFHGDIGIVALVDGRMRDADLTWLHCCNHPITEAAYNHALETGEWGDVDTAIGEGRAALVEQSERGAISGQVELAAQGAAAYALVLDDGTAARAQSLRAKLLELARDADKKREAEKRPHLEAGRAVDGVWQPIIKAAQAASQTIARSLTAYETAKARKAEAERQNEPLPTKIAGGYGRAAPIRVVDQIAKVTDWEALFLHFVGDPGAREYIKGLAARAVRDGHKVPGVETETIRQVGAK